MRSLILGAGFSKWAANLPLASNLFDFKIDKEFLSASDKRRLQLIKKDWVDWQVNQPTATAEQFIYWSINKSSPRRSRVIWYVTRRLTEPFLTYIQGGYATLMINDKLARDHKGSIKARKLLSMLLGYGLNGIITCNYDMLIEFSLGTGGYNYGMYGEKLEGRGHNPAFPWQHTPVYTTGRIPLAKLHGSLSWDKDKKYSDGKPGRKGQALIVPPTPEKKPPATLESVWNLGEEILQDSIELIIFGFAFNPYDDALLKYFRQNGRHIKRLLIIDPNPNKRAARKLWPKAKIEVINERSKFISGINDWILSTNKKYR